MDDCVYIQWAHGGDHLQVETTGNDHLPPNRQLSPIQEDRMVQLGFVRQRDIAPNWWTQTGDMPRDFGYDSTARMLIRALREVYGIPAATIEDTLGDYLRLAAHDPDAFLYQFERGRYL